MEDISSDNHDKLIKLISDKKYTSKTTNKKNSNIKTFNTGSIISDVLSFVSTFNRISTTASETGVKFPAITQANVMVLILLKC